MHETYIHTGRKEGVQGVEGVDVGVVEAEVEVEVEVEAEDTQEGTQRWNDVNVCVNAR